MEVLPLVKGYLTLNALVILSAGSLFLLRRLTKHISFAHQLKFAYVLMAGCALLPFIQAFSEPMNFMEPTSQLFAAPSMKGPAEQFAKPATMTISITPKSIPVDAGTTLPVLAAILFLGVAATLAVLAGSLVKISVIRRDAFILRRFRSVHILASERISAPFSFWCPGRNIIVVPAVMASDTRSMRIAVAHEMQHHRQRDTRWLYLSEFLKSVCFWNPCSYVLTREVSQLQEFACDEALAGHRGISSSAYCRCLLWVAEHTLGANRPLAGTASMASSATGNILKRRISIMMTSRKESVTKRSAVKIGTIAIAALTMMGSITLAAHAGIQDRRITQEDAESMATKAKSDHGFPIVVNEEVLAQLNRYLGTPDGREFMRRALERKKKYDQVLTTAIAKYNLPPELLAIPAIESGYRNISQGANPRHGAGIWMFIAQTARNFGLRVDSEADERLNVPKETDAAMRYLASLHLRFNDWGLALLGYNAGEGFVQRAIRETGSRDVWHLVRNRYENDPEYMAKVIAAVLIMKNPERLK